MNSKGAFKGIDFRERFIISARLIIFEFLIRFFKWQFKPTQIFAPVVPMFLQSKKSGSRLERRDSTGYPPASLREQSRLWSVAGRECLTPARHRLSPRGETDITFGFGPRIRGSNPFEGNGYGRRVGPEGSGFKSWRAYRTMWIWFLVGIVIFR